jgi:predicted DNA-binding ribbon-helix-helix protein
MPRAKVKRSAPWDEALTAVQKSDDGLISRNLRLGCQRTSVRLDAVMWSLLGEVARREGLTIHELSAYIKTKKPKGLSLTASIRRYLLLYFRHASTESGHKEAGHGSPSLLA